MHRSLILSLEHAKNRILERVPLSDLIGESVSLQSQSGRKVGLCPFHSEKSPSFFVFDKNYHCFGCKAHGDAISFVRAQLGLSFIEALKHLAKKYSIEAPELFNNQLNEKKQQEASLSYRALSITKKFYIDNLWSEKGAKARSYLKERGFSEEKMREFHFGLSLDENSSLANHLKRNGIPPQIGISSSLIANSTYSNGFYDFFRNRVMIPIHDRHGRAIAFGGRTLGDDPAKYKNSRETSLFVKSSTLFGFDQARESIRTKKHAIIVEGYMDALQLWNYGFTETVACLGVALTTNHLKILANLTNLVYLVFDGDTAGRQAILRTVKNALEIPQLEIRVIPLPEGMDPDSMVREHGQEHFQQLIIDSYDLLDYAISTRFKNIHPLGIPNLIQEELIPWLLTFSDQIKRSFLLKKIESLSGIPFSELKEQLQKASFTHRNEPQAQKTFSKEPLPPTPPQEPANKPAPLPPLNRLEFEIAGHIYFSSPGKIDIDLARRIVTKKLELSGLWLDFFMEMLTSLENGESPQSRSKSDWDSSFEDSVLKLIDSLEQRKGAFEFNDQSIQIDKIYKKIKILSLKNSRAELKKLLLKHPSNDEEFSESARVLEAISNINSELEKIEKELFKT